MIMTNSDLDKEEVVCLLSKEASDHVDDLAVGNHKCQECNYNAANQLSLVSHFAATHLKTKLDSIATLLVPAHPNKADIGEDIKTSEDDYNVDLKTNVNKCPFCVIAFTTPKKLTRHVEEEHNKERLLFVSMKQPELNA
jgi:hypothetical protein